MKRKKRVSQVTMALVLAATCLGFCPASAEQSEANQAGKKAASEADAAVAVVNGAKIHESDLRFRVEAVRRGSKKLDLSPDGVLELRKAALQHLIGFELLYQDSLSLRTEDIDRQVDDMLAAAEQQMGSRKGLVEQLARDGLTLEGARKNLRKNLLIQAEIDQRVVPHVKVAEPEIQAFYQANQDRITHEELVGARHILIRIPEGGTEEEKKAALEKITSLRKELSEGKDFSDLAKANSECPSREEGGDLGYFPKGAMVPEFEEVAFSLKEGEVSEVVQTQFGYHLVQVYGREPAGPWPLEDVREQIEKELKDKKVWEAINALIEKLRKKAKIKILDKTLAEK